MRAMVLPRIVSFNDTDEPLQLEELPLPVPAVGEVRIRVTACGVCHTELDEIEGRTAPPKLPIVLGHEIVGRVERLGKGVSKRQIGDRVGVGSAAVTAAERQFYCRGQLSLGALQQRSRSRHYSVRLQETLPAPGRFPHPGCLAGLL